MTVAKESPADRGGLTLKEISDKLGISRARVGQLEKSALKKMRRELERRGFTKEQAREFFKRDES
jgi:DNA-directed RNA polymerase sigma subunit (sigma70/sigma32)